MNTFEELIEVFEDWDSQLRAAKIEHIIRSNDELEQGCDIARDESQDDCEPGGMS